jgi:hypothetical protein
MYRGVGVLVALIVFAAPAVAGAQRRSLGHDLDGRPIAVRPAVGGQGTTFTINLNSIGPEDIQNGRTRNYDLSLRGPDTCSDDDAEPPDVSFRLRRGRARVIVGGHGIRVVGRNYRRAPAVKPLCRGRWLGYFDNNRVFTFVVR